MARRMTATRLSTPTCPSLASFEISERRFEFNVEQIEKRYCNKPSDVIDIYTWELVEVADDESARVTFHEFGGTPHLNTPAPDPFLKSNGRGRGTKRTRLLAQHQHNEFEQRIRDLKRSCVGARPCGNRRRGRELLSVADCLSRSGVGPNQSFYSESVASRNSSQPLTQDFPETARKRPRRVAFSSADDDDDAVSVASGYVSRAPQQRTADRSTVAAAKLTKSTFDRVAFESLLRNEPVSPQRLLLGSMSLQYHNPRFFPVEREPQSTTAPWWMTADCDDDAVSVCSGYVSARRPPAIAAPNVTTRPRHLQTGSHMRAIPFEQPQSEMLLASTSWASVGDLDHASALQLRRSPRVASSSQPAPKPRKRLAERHFPPPSLIDSLTPCGEHYYMPGRQLRSASPVEVGPTDEQTVVLEERPSRTPLRRSPRVAKKAPVYTTARGRGQPSTNGRRRTKEQLAPTDDDLMESSPSVCTRSSAASQPPTFQPPTFWRRLTRQAAAADKTFDLSESVVALSSGGGGDEEAEGGAVRSSAVVETRRWLTAEWVAAATEATATSAISPDQSVKSQDRRVRQVESYCKRRYHLDAAGFGRS